MSTTEDTAMAESSDPASRFRLALNKKKTKKSKGNETIVEAEPKLLVHYPMRILMTADITGTKSTQKSTYNPIPKIKTLLLTMADLDPGLTVTAIDGKSTLHIGKDKFPITETVFKTFFSCDWETNGKTQKNQLRIGCQINGNRTLNNIKHAVKLNQLLSWLYREQVYLEADGLGVGKTKTIGYLTHIHPRLINRNHRKTQLVEIMEMTHINFNDACKLDISLKPTSGEMTDISDDPTVNCPPFEIFHTSIGTGPANARSETDVIGIKCNVGKSALVREFFLQAAEQLEIKRQGKFVPAGLANVIGQDTMKKLICDNNKYLKSTSSVPIYGIPKEALLVEMEINDEDDNTKKVRITALDYILSAEWCHGLEPTDSVGKYFLITTNHQLSEAREWIDDNFEELFTEYLPRFGTFSIVEGYDHPKRGDKPLFSNQLGTYADKLRSLYPATTDKTTNQTKKWNKSPLHKNRNNINRTLIFDTDEYPALSTSKPNPKRTQQGDRKPLSTSPKSASTVAITAQEIRDQIIKDMTNDVTKLINTEIKNLRNELTSNLTSLKTDLQQDLNSQITEVLKTIQTLNQRFNEVMERLPSSPTQTPAHKKPKGLGVSN